MVCGLGWILQHNYINGKWLNIPAAVIACACAMRIDFDFENIARHSCYIKVD